MAFDGAFLHKTVAELKEAVDCHIDKIYQPSREELVFLLRKKGFVKRLLITVKSGAARLQFTESKYENPAAPPNFCMLLRKHLSSARLTDILQPGLERVAELVFTASNELGDSVTLRLVCELIGNRSNVILVKEDGKIADALRHTDVETAFSQSSQRIILPGAVYEYPPSQQKNDPFNCDLTSICREICLCDNFSRELLSRFDGLSPLICRELEHRALLSSAESDEAVSTALEAEILKLRDCLKPHTPSYLVASPDGDALDFSFMPILQYGASYKSTAFEDCSHLLDGFYSAKEVKARVKAAAHDIIRLVSNLHSRTEKKLALRLSELKQCENREHLRIYGELIKANLHAIPSGSRSAEVMNFYDPELKSIKIPLNPALSPAKNAEKYFKDYKKTYSAEQTLTALTALDREELVYFEAVLDSISRAESISEIAEIREELVDGGYLKSNQPQKRKKTAVPEFKEYFSQEGYRILVGKNNLQNDLITTKLASKNDLWFHVKGIPGSHVVVFSGGKDVSDDTLLLAARLAAENSKAAPKVKAPVDYTLIKNVKKPSGAKPGMVIYTTNKTLFVAPGE